MVSYSQGNLSFDLGNLAAYDISTLDSSSIFDLTKANIAKFLETLRGLEKESNEEGDFFILPKPILRLPRAKKPPTEKPLTKWEKFRVQSGMGRRRKRSRLVYEPSVEGYVPRYGAYSIKKLKNKQSAITESKASDPQPEKQTKLPMKRHRNNSRKKSVDP